MIRLSNVIHADNMRNPDEVGTFDSSGTKQEWHVARPIKMSCLCLFKRVYLAWLVFIGRRDVLIYWEDEIEEGTLKE